LGAAVDGVDEELPEDESDDQSLTFEIIDNGTLRGCHNQLNHVSRHGRLDLHTNLRHCCTGRRNTSPCRQFLCAKIDCFATRRRSTNDTRTAQQVPVLVELCSWGDYDGPASEKMYTSAFWGTLFHLLLHQSKQLQPANQQLRTTEVPSQQLQPADLQQPAVTTVLQLPAPVRQTGRLLKRKMRLFQKRLQPFERMTTLNKDVMRLSWIVDEETAAEVIHNGKIVQIDDIRGDVNITVSDERESIGDIASYFSSPAREVVSLIVEDLQEVDWPCSHCQCVSSASENWVQCDLCLQWSHYRCVELRTKPSSKLWFCDRCN